MKEIDGNFAGEIRFDPIKYTKAITRIVTKNNEMSGKVTVPYEYINEKVVVFFLRKVRKK